MSLSDPLSLHLVIDVFILSCVLFQADLSAFYNLFNQGRLNFVIQTNMYAVFKVQLTDVYQSSGRAAPRSV